MAAQDSSARECFEPSILIDHGDADTLTQAVVAPNGVADGPYAS